MTDTERIDWLERTGANVVADVNDALLPAGFSVCVNRVTPWVTRFDLREAIDEAARLVSATHPKLHPITK